jgi:hypothetical protein
MSAPSRSRLLSLLLMLVLGIAVGWIAHPPERTPSASTQMPAAKSTSIRPSRPAAHETPTQSDGAQSPPTRASTTTADEHAIPSPAASPASDKLTVDPNSVLPSGAAHNAPTSQSPGALDDLLTALSISCQFDRGNNAWWQQEAFKVGDASWQGGLIVYDLLDVAAYTARMSGSEGATGSNTGEVNVRFAVTLGGLTFSAFVPRGDLITTTVFATADKRGRYLAVMSTHSTKFSYNSSQFYGLCDTLP